MLKGSLIKRKKGDKEEEEGRQANTKVLSGSGRPPVTVYWGGVLPKRGQPAVGWPKPKQKRKKKKKKKKEEEKLRGRRKIRRISRS